MFWPVGHHAVVPPKVTVSGKFIMQLGRNIFALVYLMWKTFIGAGDTASWRRGMEIAKKSGLEFLPPAGA